MNNVVDYFENLQKEAFTGTVDITSSQGHATVLLKEGQFIWAHRPLNRAIERFQKITWLKLPSEESLATAQEWGDFVSLLLIANTDQYGRVIRLLKMDRLEVFFRIFFWTNIELVPKSAEIPPMDGQLNFYSISPTGPLLTEARERLENWPQMKQKIGSSRRIFLLQIDPHSIKPGANDSDGGFIETTEGANAPSSGLPFLPEELELLRLCDGRNTVQDLVRILPEGEFLVVRRLLDLWKRGALRPKDDEESLISVYASPEDVSPRDLLASVWMILVVSVCFLLLNHFSKTERKLDAMPQQVFQALEVYRKAEGKYPMTLSELPPKLLHPSLIRYFEYSLPDPQVYEIRVRSH